MNSSFSTQDPSNRFGNPSNNDSDSNRGSFVSSSHQPQGINYKPNAENEKKNIWASLLKEVGVRGETRPAHLLILGDRGAGKRSLLKAMNKPFLRQLGIDPLAFEEIGSNYAMFESSYLYVRDIADMGEEGGQQEDSTLSRVNVWVISDPEMGAMIPKVLTPEDLEYTYAMIMPDTENPWEMMDQCEKWMSVLKEGIFQITPKLEFKVMNDLRERIENLFKTYEEPEFDADGKLIVKKIKNKNFEDSRAGDKLEEFDTSMMEDQEMIDNLKKEMDLPEGTLVTNLFIPVSVVVSKVDLIEHGEREIKATLEKNLDFIQYCLRKFCLTYGASLVFASANSNSNVPLLYEYFLNRIYDQEFPHPSNISDKGALFVPTGFDSRELIESSDVMKFVNDYKFKNQIEPAFNDIIQQTSKQAQPLAEVKVIECQDWKGQLENLYKQVQTKQLDSTRARGQIRGTAALASMAARKAPDNQILKVSSPATENVPGSTHAR